MTLSVRTRGLTEFHAMHLKENCGGTRVIPITQFIQIYFLIHAACAPMFNLISAVIYDMLLKESSS